MRVTKINTAVNFQKRPSDMADYTDTLMQAKAKAGNCGKSVLIIPADCLPNSTGVGNLGTEESLKFFDFAKQYWGINELQILPAGRFHKHNGHYPIYSGSSMDLGEQMIDIKSFIPESDYQKIVKNHKQTGFVDYENIISHNSVQEEVLKNLYDNMNSNMKAEFELYKTKRANLLEKNGLYHALREINGTHEYKNWNATDKNLFNPDIVDSAKRQKRIEEIHKLKGKKIDFYKFKQYLAEKSLEKAKRNINSKGLKLNGDMICGFSYDEVWSHPKAFIENATIGWGLPALNFDTPEAEKLLREKVRLYAERYDGFRVDASWTYVNQPVNSTYKDHGDRILNIIDDEVKKVKGVNYDLKNIMHEFAASSEQFSLYSGDQMKPYLKDRVKIYTSEGLSSDWGSNKSFLKRGWNPKSFIIGASNHDSDKIKLTDRQAEILSDILKIPRKKLEKYSEIFKAKLAEPLCAYNNMIYFTEALGLNGPRLTTVVPDNYEKTYLEAVKKGEAYNPMDALEKIFKANGLDKENPKLYGKIVKYRKILEDKTVFPFKKAGIAVLCLILAGYGIYKYTQKTKPE